MKWRLFRSRAVEWLTIVFLIVLIIAPLSILGWLLFATTTFTIQTITIVDAREHTSQAIREKIDHLTGKNILLIETSSLEQSLISQVPQIRDIRIERKLPSALKIVVQEKTPALLFLSNGKYYFVDQQGIAYEEASLDTLPGIVLPTVKNTGEQAAVQVGEPAVNNAFVTFIQNAQEQLPKILPAQIAEIRIPSLAAREVHMLLTNNWLIRFDTSRLLTVQTDILKRLLANTISAEDQPKIEYIDLRIPNRVYYKIKGK